MVALEKAGIPAVGIVARDHLFPAGLDEVGLLDLVRDLNADRGVHGVLIQLPLPPGLDEDRVMFWHEVAEGYAGRQPLEHVTRDV